MIPKLIVILFGLFIIFAGFIMLLNPEKARRIVSRAGSTIFINYAELILRMSAGIALILSAENSKSEFLFQILGWFITVSSVIIMIVPRKLHHQYSVKSAKIIKPNYFRIISPFSFLFGGFLIYAVL